jgi:vitamin B12 transporter
MMKCMTRAAMLIAAVSAMAAPAAAQRATPTAEADTVPRYVLEGVTVTARRTPALREDLPQKVEVVSSADLERTVGTGAADALKETLGLDVIQYPGLLAGVSIRGFRPQFSGIGTRTLILVDGRPSGVTNLATLDLAAFERIEALKGPASALHGSSAMGGVINLVSRSSAGPIAGAVSGSYGSFGSYQAQVTAGGDLIGGIDFDVLLGGAGRGRGYEVGARRLLSGDSVVKFLADGETVKLAEVFPDSTITFSDYSTRTGSLRLGYQLGERWRANGRIGFFEGEGIENPGDLIAGWGQTLNDLNRRTGEISLTGGVGIHALDVRAYATVERTRYYDDPFAPEFISFEAPVESRGLQIQDVVAVGRSTVTVGIDRAESRAESARFASASMEAPPYAPDSEVRSTAAFAEASVEAMDGRLLATFGGRLDDVTFEVEEGQIWDFGTWSAARVAGASERHLVFNPSAGVLYRLGGGIRAHASAGRAFVTPDPFFVAGYAEARPDGRQAVLVTQGNPALDPESSASWDAGITLARPERGIEADLTFFSTDVRDRIVPVSVPTTGTQLTASGDTILSIRSYANADLARIRGLEGRAAYDLAAPFGFRHSLRIFASGTRLFRAEEITSGEHTRIKNVADLTIVGGLDFDDRRRFGGRLSMRYVGDRLDTDFTDWRNPGNVRYPEFLVMDASARLRAGAGLSLHAAVDNLLDENYYEVRGYNLPGRALRLGASLGF